MVNNEDAVLSAGWLGLALVVGGVHAIVVGEAHTHAAVLLDLELTHPLLVNREGCEVISVRRKLLLMSEGEGDDSPDAVKHRVSTLLLETFPNLKIMWTTPKLAAEFFCHILDSGFYWSLFIISENRNLVSHAFFV